MIAGLRGRDQRAARDVLVGAEALRSLVAVQGPERLRALLEETAAQESFLIAGVAQAALSKLGRYGRGSNLPSRGNQVAILPAER